MTQIVLATINARFIHASLGLRYLYANLGELQKVSAILEFENSRSAKEIAETIVQAEPTVVGFGVYIWNTTRTREVISILRKVVPGLIIVIGGPEVSYEYEQLEIFSACDYLITGEADVAFADLCRQLLRGERPTKKALQGGLPELRELVLPYSCYSDADIAHRVIYVEVSRGCPFTCEFCLSSIDIPVRQFDHAAVLRELDALYQRGARVFKFVDRTFNLNLRVASEILRFFLERMTPELFVHFEMVPDRFPSGLRELVAKFPPGSLQLEIGIQSLNSHVGTLIRRRQDVPKLLENIRFLRSETAAHLHVDLIVGLPGEDLASFARGFDTIVELGPHEIQVGILKRLRGTPIERHSDEYLLKFSDDPPYEVLSTRDLSYLDMQRMERFARYWDLVGNSGNFSNSRILIWQGVESAFYGFLEWSDWLFARVGRRASIELKVLVEHLFEFLVTVRGVPAERAGSSLSKDYMRSGRKDLPAVLQEFRVESMGPVVAGSRGGKRQSRHATTGC